MHPLRRFQKNLDSEIITAEADKSIVRPTFSYMGDYIISDNVINSIAIHEAQKIDGLIKVQNINLRKTGHGVHIDMTVILQYGCDIFSVCKNIQLAVRNNVEQYTSINARRINILVKNLREITIKKGSCMDKFELVSEFKPQGDQPQAIQTLVDGIKKGEKCQTLLGVTGSGKTFTMANVIAQVNKPTIVLAHNKTLAAQLCSEFKEFFPNNCVEFFVSYYDYYQPEAYIPQTDTFIEKNSLTNDEIDKLRHSATFALLERKDVIIVASVSCIYGLGDPEDYKNLMLSLRVGMVKDRDELLKKLVSMQYERNDINFVRNKFRVRGDVVEIFPSNNGENAIRVEFFGDEIERICEVNVITGEIVGVRQHAVISPASHYVTTNEK